MDISRNSMRSLLYPGATTKIYAHFMAWFGDKSHIDVGYKSNDAAQVARQVTDMKSSDIDGAIVDWYGNKNVTIDGATLLLKDECERRKDFEIIICFDNGLFNSKPSTISATDYLIQQIKYVKTTYMSSPQYGKAKDGRFLALEFGMSATGPDWNKIVAMFPEIAFLHRNVDGFTKPGAGAFSWLDSANSSAGYLSNFLTTSTKYPKKLTMGSVWKGFDDRKAAWSKNRVVDGRNGQLYLDTFAAINKMYSADHQLDLLQVVTWNDYEEGTAFEAGVENGVKLDAHEANGIASVTIATGNAQTIDHFEASVNGSPYTRLQGQSINLTESYDSPGNYAVTFRAYGKARVVNALSPEVVATAKPMLEWI